MFCVTYNLDIEDWLPLPERASNCWDYTIVLVDILVYLKRTAKVWPCDHEGEIGMRARKRCVPCSASLLVERQWPRRSWHLVHKHW